MKEFSHDSDRPDAPPASGPSVISVTATPRPASCVAVQTPSTPPPTTATWRGGGDTGPPCTPRAVRAHRNRVHGARRCARTVRAGYAPPRRRRAARRPTSPAPSGSPACCGTTAGLPPSHEQQVRDPGAWPQPHLVRQPVHDLQGQRRAVRHPEPGAHLVESTTLTPSRAKSEVPSSSPASRSEIPTRSHVRASSTSPGCTTRQPPESTGRGTRSG